MTRAEYANRPRKRRPNHLPEDKMFDFLLTRALIVKGKLNTPCFIWQGHKSPRGYGAIGFRKKVWRVHRVAWVLKRGAIPKGKEICHECDMPSCFNPDHLFAGTHLQNIQDADRKGLIHRAKGEDHGHAKLTEAQVLAIRKEYVPMKVSRHKLAVKFNVSYSLIAMITRRQIWKHI